MEPNTQLKKIKNKYIGSPHDLYTRQPKFTIAGCSGVYYLKRINEFGDSVLMVEIGKNEWTNAGTVTVPRRGELNVAARINGITFEKRIKLSLITEINGPIYV